MKALTTKIVYQERGVAEELLWFVKKGSANAKEPIDIGEIVVSQMVPICLFFPFILFVYLNDLGSSCQQASNKNNWKISVLLKNYFNDF